MKPRKPITIRTVVVLFIILLHNLGSGHRVIGGSTFQISGYYLGGTPEELGVTFEDDSGLEEKHFEAEANDVQLFFIRVRGRMRAYRIIKEETVDEKNIKSILDALKGKYGPPDRQQIKTSSVRPRFQMKYVTTVKNRAIWNISETQEFIAEIESKRVIYELIDHNPEEIQASKKQGDSGDGEPDFENWDPDY